MDQSRTLGLLSAILVLFVWSGFFVVSRAGVQTALTPSDMTLLRLLVAGVVTLPFALFRWPSHLGFLKTLVIVICGPGILYSIFMFVGLGATSVAYGGVFANGAMPIFTAVIFAAMTSVWPGRREMVGIAVIIFGAVLMGASGMSLGGDNIFIGVLNLLGAAAVLSIYTACLRHWRIAAIDALILINVPNALVFIPIWYFLLPSGMADAQTDQILLQALFLGLGPGFVAVFLFAYAASNLGPTTTAGFSAAVPACAAILAIPLLAEIPSVWEWVGIVAVTIGLAIMIFKK